jgi:hypothetical protein
MRIMHKQFAHDYPDIAAERFERLQAAIHAAQRLLALMAHLDREAVLERFESDVKDLLRF